MMDRKSLAERCLQVIIGKFDRFSHAFNTTEDAKLKRNFEFLQRCYSNEIMQVLSTLATVNEDYFPLLINKHLREFNLGLLDRIDGETMTRMIAEVGEGLVKISFSIHRTFYHPDPPFADIFPHLKNVAILNMVKTCNDEALKNIAKYCPNLVELNIADSLVTNEGLKRFLCQKNDKNEVPNSKLQKLNLDGTGINDDQTELILKSFPHLEVLDSPSMPCILHKMHENDIDQNNICNVRKYKLTHLDAMFCTDLATSPELLKLYALLCPDVSVLSSTIINSDQLNTLAEFQKLKNVVLEHDDDFPHPTVNSFLNSRGGGLVVLNLNGFALSVEQLIKSCPLLEELHLKDPFFEPVAETTTKEFKFLRKLYLEGVHFSDAATAKSVNVIISSVHKLEKLGFYRCRFLTGELKEAIIYCCIHCPLKEIYFSNSDVDLPLLESILLSCCTLKKLRVVNSTLGTINSELNQDNIYFLEDIAANLKHKPEFEYQDEESDLNSDGDLHDIFDFYDEFDDYDHYIDDDDDDDDVDDDDVDDDDFDGPEDFGFQC